MANLNDISEAARDADLLDRMVSAAAELGVQDPNSWVHNNSRVLATAYIADGNTTNTIASVYAYARDTRPPAPGANPAAITDEYIRHAVQSVINPS